MVTRGLTILGYDLYQDVLLIGMCLPLIWIGYAWGVDSVRRPQANLRSRMRWSWLVAVGISAGCILAPSVSAVWLFFTRPQSSEIWFEALLRWWMVCAMSVTVLAVLPAVSLALLARGIARRMNRWCIKCGYDLRGGGGALCPECGTPVASSPQALVIGSSTPEAEARRHVLRGVRVAGGAIAAVAVVAITGSVAFDCLVQKAEVQQTQGCALCGAVQELRRSPRWHIPLSARQAVSFAASATCQHQWMEPAAYHSALSEIAPANSDAVVLLRIPPLRSTSGPSELVFAALELPPSTNGSETLFTMHWRAGPGSLMAADAHTAEVRLAVEPHSLWRGGTPPRGSTATSDVRTQRGRPNDEQPPAERVLRNPTARDYARMGGQSELMMLQDAPVVYPSGAPSDPKSWILRRGSGSHAQMVMKSTWRIGLAEGVLYEAVDNASNEGTVGIAVVTKDEWQRIRAMPASWDGVKFVGSLADRFGPVAVPP